jgi:hypothetical protein
MSLKTAALKMHDSAWGRKVDNTNSRVAHAARRIPSLNELTRVWRPEGYHKLFCAHDIPRWKPCPAKGCTRSVAEARKFAEQLLAVKA